MCVAPELPLFYKIVIQKLYITLALSEVLGAPGAPIWLGSGGG